MSLFSQQNVEDFVSLIMYFSSLSDLIAGTVAVCGIVSDLAVCISQILSLVFL